MATLDLHRARSLAPSGALRRAALAALTLLACASAPEVSDNEQGYRDALARKLEALRAKIARDGATPPLAAEFANLARGGYRAAARVEGDARPNPGVTDEAIRYLQAAARLYPDEAGALHLVAANLYLLREQPDEAAAALLASIERDPKAGTFRQLLELPRSAAVDAAVVSACTPMREEVDEAGVLDLVLLCLDAAGDDRARLRWPAVELDIAELDEALAALDDDARRARVVDARARVFTDRRHPATTVAAIFGLGECHVDNCGRGGWTGRALEGEVQVRCGAESCLRSGWEARLPGGAVARATCVASDCTTGGWKLVYPDGQAAVTRCHDQRCATEGWTTTLPDGDEAVTRCHEDNCEQRGFTTALPGGAHLTCACVREQCFNHGATCQ